MSASASERTGERGESGRVRTRAREAPARTGRAEERGARVGARDRQDGRHHAVLDERARDDERHLHVLAGLVRRDQLLLGLLEHLLQRRRVHARRFDRLLERDVHVHVRLLVVDDDVHVVLVLGVVTRRPADRRRAHAVELADLRVALQHLQAVGVVRDLERRRRHHAAAAEGARLVARDARLELGRARRAGDVVHVLLLRRRRDVQQELRSGAGFGEYIGVAAARRPESRQATRLRRYNEHVRGDLVPRHARLGRLDALVQAKAARGAGRTRERRGEREGAAAKLELQQRTLPSAQSRTG